ncbi:MAG: hypothetical protein KGJ93_03840 [Patescibacteria group bacterium]|nr:hypothetical protein [Patescibacteria group bacterium]
MIEAKDPEVSLQLSEVAEYKKVLASAMSQRPERSQQWRKIADETLKKIVLTEQDLLAGRIVPAERAVEALKGAVDGLTFGLS